MLFSVCTATFNRKHTLERVFESLRKQILTDFEWIIVDDGSVDGTHSLVTQWQETANFPINYIYQDNSGKHIAVNKAAILAKGRFFLIADSDDIFPNDALAIFWTAWQRIPKQQRFSYTGVTGLCASDDGAIIGDKFPSEEFTSTPADLFYRWNIVGEKWGFHRTDVIRKFPFPELSGYPFVRESIVWNKIGQQYKTLYINQIVRTYKQDATSQLSKIGIKERSFESLFYAESLNNDEHYITTAPWKFFKMAVQGARLAFHHKTPPLLQLRRLKSVKLKILWSISICFGLSLYVTDRVLLSTEL